MSVLVFVENIEGKFKKSAFEVVSYAKTIANTLNQKLTAISIGDVSDTALESLGKYGANKILNVNSEKLKSFINQAYASIITQAAKQEEATIIVLSNSFSGKGLAPRIAAKMEAGLADGAVGLPEINENNFRIKKTAFSGKAFALTELTSVIKVIALNPNSFELRDEITTPEITTFEADLHSQDFNTIVKEIVRTTDKISLPDAEIVVSGGRGLKGPENWGIIEDLANALGAATACSKPVSDAGWRPHEEHVGQTGIAVSPNLYIAIGISGAIQHLAGVSSSKTIVVINKDPEAPFFKVADYGIVGDAFEIVPKITSAIKALKES
ncbi:electron transfer flavoprotein subunit alpha/FixB family protein [Olivibacter domesticus]|uniref:Electron transfer flavoprotein alpha subunit apoprotein n=1 Tax=Olivibacter domesticus TaxID=407022 RepID=A0A1H7PR07_OLID1|nr:electron transfer flavoprotein subunit alpha/FixB family protein [Olivibacter domesticus]SEL37824.1 electron transfer flavoprotein alpha subunit apoprotein [Olivibacter domesticus]